MDAQQSKTHSRFVMTNHKKSFLVEGLFGGSILSNKGRRQVTRFEMKRGRQASHAKIWCFAVVWCCMTVGLILGLFSVFFYFVTSRKRDCLITTITMLLVERFIF